MGRPTAGVSSAGSRRSNLAGMSSLQNSRWGMWPLPRCTAYRTRPSVGMAVVVSLMAVLGYVFALAPAVAEETGAAGGEEEPGAGFRDGLHGKLRHRPGGLDEA